MLDYDDCYEGQRCCFDGCVSHCSDVATQPGRQKSGLMIKIEIMSLFTLEHAYCGHSRQKYFQL